MVALMLQKVTQVRMTPFSRGVVERDAGAGAAVGVVLTLIIIAVYVITNLILKDSDLEY